MMLARGFFLLAVLGAEQGALALPTPRDEATESVISTGCAQQLATAFAALPAACGVEAEDYEKGGWEAEAAACEAAWPLPDGGRLASSYA